ncbi:TRPC2 protein, partial [Cisticola juncidis]|nr:TRPC2 protein [Cisticola juncidis]
TADFSQLTVGQRWDHMQFTCSQPFSLCSCFGLSFICLYTAQEKDALPATPGWSRDCLHCLGSPLVPQEDELSDKPWCSSPAFHQTFFPEPCLRSCLWKLEGAAWSPAHLSRCARMALAAQNQALRPRAG